MTSDLTSLNNIFAFECSETIKIANGQGLPIQHTSSTVIKTPSHSFMLKQVLHVPSIAVNLMSIPQLCKGNT